MMENIQLKDEAAAFPRRPDRKSFLKSPTRKSARRRSGYSGGLLHLGGVEAPISVLPESTNQAPVSDEKISAGEDKYAGLSKVQFTIDCLQGYAMGNAYARHPAGMAGLEGIIPKQSGTKVDGTLSEMYVRTLQGGTIITGARELRDRKLIWSSTSYGAGVDAIFTTKCGPVRFTCLQEMQTQLQKDGSYITVLRSTLGNFKIATTPGGAVGQLEKCN
jgi:hypothetical protein